MMLFNISSLLSLLLALDVASALYFHIAEGERKCFIEEIPDDTTVIGKELWFTEFTIKLYYLSSTTNSICFF